MKCEKCSHNNPQGSTFCEACGAKLTTAVVQKPVQFWFCPECGTKNVKINTFCQECGHQRPTATPTTPSSTKPQAPRVTRAEQKVQRTKKTKSPTKKKLLVIGLVILLLVLAGGSGWYFWNNNSQTKDSITTKPAAKTMKHKKSHSMSMMKPTLAFDTSAIKDEITALVPEISGTTQVYVSPVNSKKKVLYGGNSPSRAASSIKLFIMAYAYHLADKSEFDLDETITLEDDMKVGGTGTIRDLPAGAKITNAELIARMMVDSDNTAANIIIDQLDMAKANKYFHDTLAATATTLSRKMMDTKALESDIDNYSSAEDQGLLLKKIYNGTLVSKKLNTKMLTVLSENHNHNKLPKLLPTTTKIYNKTGEYGDFGVENDAAIIAVPGKGALVVTVMSVAGKSNEQQEMMNNLGLKLYQSYFEQ